MIGALEGVAELVGDLVIRCQGGTPTQPGQVIPLTTLLIYFNTTVTSRLIATSPNLSETLLLIDEPAPQNQFACPMLPCFMQGTGGFTNPYDGAAGHYNVFQASQPGWDQINALEWVGIPFDPPGSGNVRTLRVTNVRLDLNSIANEHCLGCLMEPVAQVSSPDLKIESALAEVGYIQQSLLFGSSSSVFSSSSPHNPTTPTTDFTLLFSEGLPSAFKPRTVAADPSDTTPNANQNVPGVSYGSASGFYNASFIGTYSGAGLATQGTRLMARFENVPPGVKLFVTEKPIGGSESLGVQMIATGPLGEGPYTPVHATVDEFVPIEVSNGVAIAVWEVMAANPSTSESVRFGVAVSFDADPSNPIPEVGLVTVKGFLAPLTSTRNASLSDPVPRFGDNARAQTAFKISDHFSPTITRIADAGAHYLAGTGGLPVAPGGLLVIFGSDLTAHTGTGVAVPASTLGGTSVRINGFVAPILDASLMQVEVQIPWELTGLSAATLTLDVNGVESKPANVLLADTAPRLFVNEYFKAVVSLPSSLQAGGTLIVYGTGFGPVRNQPPTGAPAVDFTSTTIQTPVVTIGGQPAEVIFSGLAPGMVGVWEVSVKLPDGVDYSSPILVGLVAGGVQSNGVLIN